MFICMWPKPQHDSFALLSAFKPSCHSHTMIFPSINMHCSTRFCPLALSFQSRHLHYTARLPPIQSLFKASLHVSFISSSLLNFSSHSISSCLLHLPFSFTSPSSPLSYHVFMSPSSSPHFRCPSHSMPLCLHRLLLPTHIFLHTSYLRV